MLAKLFGRKPSVDESAQTPRPAGSILLENLDKLDSFPTLSDTAVRAMAMTNDPSASLADVGELIRRDGVLTAATLKLANTWAFRGKQPTNNVQQAVVRLGLKECARLITAMGMRNLYSKSDRRIAEACDTLLKHSFFVASLASSINKRFHFGFAGEEFTAGLLHDIGRIIFCIKATDQFLRVDSLDYEDAALLERERRYFRTDHPHIGSIFAVKNELPTAIGRVILNHHKPLEEVEYRLLVGLVSAADDLANHTHQEHTVADYDPSTSQGFQILAAKLMPSVRPELKASLPSIVVRAIKETHSLMKSAG